ncbi:MAG: DUF5689 domain-containing protein [Bacteroidales bacterium]|nr:DUF5689 domain-containing protein [Bacteroidales bacterium]NLM91507.1 hypothetical protein [Bacteroidales bacterium]
MITSRKIFSVLILIAGTLAFSSCVKNDFDDPDQVNVPVGTVLTIAELRSMFQGEAIEFDQDFSVYATVTMDDKSGNIYRSAYVEDETGALNLRLQAPGGIYEGDSVRIFLKGTILSSYQRMLQLDNVNVDHNIIKLATQKDFPPTTLSITDVLSGNYQSRLVRLEEVQFALAELGKTFADKENLVTENRILEDCSGNRIIVRTSGYAGFADKPIPEGSGPLVAIAATFGSDIQLYIRRLNEVELNGDRCPIPGEDLNLISLANLRQNYSEGVSNIPPNTRIEGVVISDFENDNHPGQNLFLQDESGAGIALRFSDFHEFPMGAKIRVIVSNMAMNEFNGLLQIENIPLGNAYDLGPGTMPQPVQTTIGNINSMLEMYESTLVTIPNVTITGGTTFTGNLNISDGTGQMLLYTYSWASFAGTPVPSGTVTLTGIVSEYNSPQFLIRNLNDISSK